VFDFELEPVVEGEVPDAFEVGSGDVWPHFVRAWLIAQRAQNTVRTYATAELQWRAFCAGRSLHPLQARRGDVDDWRGEVAAAGGFHGRPASANTVRLKLAAVSSLYAYLVGEDILPSSPAAHIKRPRGGDFSATAALDPQQAGRFLAAAQSAGSLAYVAMRIMLGRGLRATELVSLDVGDVRRQFGHVTVTVTHKGGRRQELPLSPGTGHLVVEYIGEREGGPLLVNQLGGRLSYWELYNLTVRVSRRARVGLDVTPHVLRATHATIYLDQAGAQIDRLQDGLGHASLNHTKAYDRGAGSLSRLASVATAVEDAFLPG